MSDPFATPSGGTARRPGQFRRKGAQGPPYVKSLTNTRKRTGNKPELLAAAEAADIPVPPKTTVAELRELLGPEPAWDLYSRPSGFGALIEDQFGLHRWQTRNTVLGIALDPTVLAILDQVAAGTLTENQALDQIIAVANDADHADTSMAADRGTFVHTLTEWAEVGMTGTPPWCDPRFNLTDRQVDAIAAGWLRLLDDNGMKILATEAPVVNDRLKLAGTLDRVAHLTRPLPFGDVTVPTNAAVIVDIKTSTLYADAAGLPSYWSGYPMQLCAYAGARPYDPDTDERGDWPYQIDQQHALIAHLDMDKVYAGEAVWQLIHVDLTVARQGIVALHAAQDYHAAAKFAIADRSIKVPCAVPVSRREQLTARHQMLNDTGKAAFALLGITVNSSDDEVAAALDSVDPFQTVSVPAERPPQPELELSGPTEIDLLRRTVKEMLGNLDAGGDINRLLLHTVKPSAGSLQHLNTVELTQLARLVDQFGTTIGLQISDDGTPALDGDVAALLAAA